MRRVVLFLSVAAVLAAAGQKKKDEEPPTQVLELPKEPPASIAAEPSRLVFRVSPLFAKGLLSQQIRDSIRWLLRQDKSIVKLRAFVAGSGDVRRVKDVVSEEFTEKRLPLPVLTVVQAGALTNAAAQVVFESVSVDRRLQNPDGLAFFSGQQAMLREPLQPIRPLAEQSLKQLATAFRAAAVAPEDILRITCYSSSLDGTDYLRQRLYTEYKTAAINLLQQNREPSRTLVECEAVGRLRKTPAQRVVMLNPPDLPQPSGYSQIALVNAPRVLFTGAQLAFGAAEPDLRLAYQRMAKTLEQAGVAFGDVFSVNTYPLAWGLVDTIRAARRDFYRNDGPPSGTLLVFEGLPALDATMALDATAALPELR